MLIGLIADTHGLVRPEVLKAFSGVDHILHAGDVGSPAVLEELSALAPVNAVRGNVDHGEWADSLPLRTAIVLGGARILLLHDRVQLDGEPPRNIQVIVSGHSHKPSVEESNGVIFINPGSAGPRRFHLPVSAALLEIRAGCVIRPRMIDLLIRAE